MKSNHAVLIISNDWFAKNGNTLFSVTVFHSLDVISVV